ncbi:MAG TPA: hypothetical protein VMM56_05700 [Planctomycetaceae bacterium]|nr:hypothetical protein [Planctomycetaceae bacterium]
MRCFVFVLAALLFVGSIRAEEPAQQEAVDRLIEQLSSSKRVERLDAIEALEKLGPEILELLPPLNTIPDLTARSSLRQIRVTLEREAALRSLEPSKVHWPENLTLGEALVMLRDQTGNPISWIINESALQQSIETGPRELTFWEAVSRLDAQFDLVLSEHKTKRELVLSLGDSADSQQYAPRTSGAFLWRLEHITTKPVVNHPDEELFRVMLSVHCEPRLRPLFMKLKHSQIVMMDEDGNPLKPFTPEAIVELPWGQSIAPVRLRLDYLVPQDKPPRELTLLMELEVDLATGTADVEFREWELPRESIRKAGVIVTREPLDATPDRLRIPLRLAYESGGPIFESHRNWVYHNELSLKHGEQTLTPDAPLELTLEANGVLGLIYTFRKYPADWKNATLLYRVPTLLIKTQVRLATDREPLLLKPKLKPKEPVP